MDDCIKDENPEWITIEPSKKGFFTSVRRQDIVTLKYEPPWNEGGDCHPPCEHPAHATFFLRGGSSVSFTTEHTHEDLLRRISSESD